MDDSQDLRNQMDRLTGRVERIEQWLGLDRTVEDLSDEDDQTVDLPTAKPTPTDPPPLPAAAAPVTPPVVFSPSGVEEPNMSDAQRGSTDHLLHVKRELPTARQPSIEEEDADRLSSLNSVVAPVASIAFAFSEEPKPVLPYVSKSKPKPVSSGEGIERAIGLKWAGWIGAIVLVIGAGFGIKYAYDNNWFGILPPQARLVLMSLISFALIGAGEWVYRRINVISAATLFGAGVATLFLVSYAGFGYYQLYDRDVAFILMGLTTLVGAAVAMRGNLVTIGVLSIIGGNLAPILLHTPHPRIAPFLFYLLTLQIVALFLSWWGGRQKWWAMRGVSIVTTALWGGAVLISQRNGDPFGAPFWFLWIYAALYQLELVMSTLKHTATFSRDARDASSLTSDAQKRGASAAAKWVVPNIEMSEPAALVSMLVTAGLTAAMLFLLRNETHAVRGVWVAGLSGLCGALGFALMGFDKLRVGALSVGYRLQAAALLVVAVPVAFVGMWVTLGWAILALAYATLGRWRNLDISRHASVITWMLALLKLVTWTAEPSHPGLATWWTLLDTEIPAYAILGWILALVAHAIALIVGKADKTVGPTKESYVHSPYLDTLSNILGSAVWLIVSMTALPAMGATFAIVLDAWLLVGVEMLAKRSALLTHAIVMLLLAMVKWAVVDALAGRLASDWSATQYSPVLNPLTGLGVLIACSLVGIYWLRRAALPAWLARGREGGRMGDERYALACAILALLTIALTLDIDRSVEIAAMHATLIWPALQVKMMAWTMLWSVAVAAWAAVGWWISATDQEREQRLQSPMATMILLTVKYLLIDVIAGWAMHGAAPVLPIANLQTLAGLFVVGGLVGARLLPMQLPVARRHTIGTLLLIVALVVGTLEVDRTFELMISSGSGALVNPRLAKQVAISIFWALFAIVSVVIGFRKDAAALRYFGLALFAVTLGKVMTVDLSHAGTAYRIVSFVGLGLLLMGTSVLYGKLGPKLMEGK